MRRLLAGLLTLSVAGGLSPLTQSGTAAAETFPTGVWTEAAHTSVFRDSLPSADAGRTIRLDMARNEFEAGQIVVRRQHDLRIDGVTFGALTSGGNTIAASNLSYNLVGYEHLNFNSHGIYPLIRYGAGDYPDRLLNQRTITVPARTTQAIWIRVFTPAATTAGTYSGTVQVETSRGPILVPISVAVRNVTLPESANGSFTNVLWQLFTGPISWDEGAGDSVDIFWGFSRYSPQWWTLMEDVARMMRQYRTNDFAIPVVRHLMDAGSRQNADGSFSFNWSRFDQVVEFMIARGVVKRLEGFWMGGFTHGLPTWNVETIDTAGRRSWVPWNSAAGQNWLNRWIPALRDHIRAKGWEDRFWMHVGDEPFNDGLTPWRGVADKIRSHWPTVKLGDAVVDFGVHEQIIDHTDIMIPLHDTYDRNTAFYDQKRAEGKELWFYNCTVPRGNYLNRFVDQPQWNQRLAIWHAYNRGATGYLHWALGNWQYPMNDQDVKGDGVIVRPDRERSTVEVSPRYESLRDGIEDYEVLNLLGQRDPGLARGLADSLVQRGDKYTTDIAYMQRIRRLALDAAAGLPVGPDLARGVTATASTGNPALAVDGNPGTAWQPGSGTQWIRLDLGRQVQLDGVRLGWGSQHSSSYKLQMSYDGSRWADIHATGNSNGGTDFMGVNGKTRYLRLETTTPGALNDLEVIGAALAKTNVAGGRSYQASVVPNNQADSGIESTDGVLADAWDDGRTWGYQSPTGTVQVNLDLGSTQLIDSARLHAYEEYPAYRPDSIRITTSVDGVNYTQRGHQFAPRGPSGIWYEFSFPPALARHVRITYTKTYTQDASAMLLDEIEVYAAGWQNHAAGRPYGKSQPAPTDPAYPDTGNKESTDGVIAGGYADGHGYGYHLPTPGSGVTLDLLLDLGTSQTLSQVRVARYDDGVHDYRPANVQVYSGNDPVGLTLRRETTTANGPWFELPTSGNDRYLKVRLNKTRTHDFGDYLFVDEVQVLDDAGTNVALGRPYARSRPAPTDPAYPDTGDRESTDGAVAGGYGDGLGYGYRLAAPGETVVVDLLIDLGTSRTVNQVTVQQFDDAAHRYDPDTVTVWTGDSPVTMTSAGETWTPSSGWLELALPASTARYLKIQIAKTRVHDLGDYLFLDEITVA